MEEPPVVLAVPAVVFTMGNMVPTSITASSLSSVTVLGLEMTFVYAYAFRNYSVAATPSALRKAVAGLKKLPLLRLATRAGALTMPPITPWLPGTVTGLPFASSLGVDGVGARTGRALLPTTKC